MGWALDELRDFFIQKEPWKEFAACRKLSRSHFFLSRGQSSKVAREACAKCPVINECEAYANANGLEGWWGGRLHKPSEAFLPNRVQVVQDVRLKKIDQG